MNRRTFVLGTLALPLARRRDQFADLKIRGHVFRRGAPGYAAAHRLYDTRWDGLTPPAVIRPRDARDVQAIVRWAADHDVKLVARSGGHAYNGASSSNSAVVVDLKHLNRMVAGPITTLGPAARNIDVTAKLARQDLAWATGSCPTVGAGGLALGGGMGLAARRHGLTLDNLVAIQVVTADGHLRTVAGDEDLFWALRGGGGNFCIVTNLSVRAFYAPKAAFFTGTLPRTAESVARWDAFAPSAPRELTSILSIPRGTGSINVFGQFLGSEPALRRAVRPLGNVTVRSDAWLPLQRRWAGCADGGLAACQAYRPQSFAAASVYVAQKTDGHAFIDAAEDATLLLDAYGGAINEVDAADTAFVHRNARFSVQILDYGSISSVAPAVARAHAKLAPSGNGQAYQNYADPDLNNAPQAWYGSNLPRLRQIKQQVDPDGRFQLRQGIRA